MNSIIKDGHSSILLGHYTEIPTPCSQVSFDVELHYGHIKRSAEYRKLHSWTFFPVTIIFIFAGTMEHNNPMAMACIPEGRYLGVNGQLLARRLKNRERQRRYRAKKRLEADLKKSYLVQLKSMWSVQAELSGSAVSSEPSAPSADTQAQSIIPTTSSITCVYSGRKWKKEARLARPSETSESQSAAVPPSRVDATPECATSSSVRRDWKADARNKIEAVACKSI